MTILEQLWHGAFRPAEIERPQTAEYIELLDTADENEKRLLSLLTDEGKELYFKLAELRTELCDTENHRIFAKGFSAGAKLMLEIMENDKKAE